MSRSISMKFRAEYDEAADEVGLVVFVPKLPVRLCAESSLLPPLAASPGAICRGGPRRLALAFSCGVCDEPIGVANCSFGGCCLAGMDSGGRAAFSDIGGAAALFTGL